MAAEEAGGTAAAAPAFPAATLSAAQHPAAEFGWVPAEVVRALLEEVGNFRARAGAIELLHASVLDAARDPGTVLPTLSAFLAFLLRLVGDANFKIAISAMTILEDLVGALGADVQPYLGTLAAPLIERMGDNVQMVRQAATHAVSALARMLGPTPLLSVMGGALVHPQWRVREEGVNAHIAALLSHTKERFDYPACVRALAGAAADDVPRVASAALEAFALLHARLGALLQGLLTAVGAPEPVKRAVAERIRQAPQLGLPTLDAHGNLQHQAHARPPSAQRAKPAAATAAARPQQVASLATALSMPRAADDTHSASPDSQLQLVPVHSPAVAAVPAAFSGLATTWPERSSPSATLDVQRLHSWSPGAAAAYPLPPGPVFAVVSSDASTISSFAANAGAYSAAANVASGIELSAPSYASSSISRASYASFSAAAGCVDAGSGQEVERSEGSLLSWQRPARRPNQLSVAGALPGGKASVAGVPSSSSPVSSSSSPVSSSLAVVGRADAAELSGFARAAKPTIGHADVQRTAAAAAAAAATAPTPVVRRSVAQQPGGAALAALPGTAPATSTALPASSTAPAAAGAGAAGAAGGSSDLNSSVRNWQRQQGSFSVATSASQGRAAGAEVGVGAGLSSWCAPAGQQGSTVQDTSLAVEPRSDSLLQWRLPAPKRGSGPAPQQATLAVAASSVAGAAQSQPASQVPGAAPSPPARIGSAAFKRTLSSFTKRLFGGEAEGGEQQAAEGAWPAEPQQVGSLTWSIAAVRQEQQPLQQQAMQPVEQLSNWPAKPNLTVLVPDVAACQLGGCNQQQQLQQQQGPESPSKGSDSRLSRLKQLNERRRVWSAPIAHHSIEVADSGEATAELGAAAAAAASSPGAEAASAVGLAKPAGTVGQEGSPGSRPGLQALKARARTARVVSTGSVLAPPSTAGASVGSSYQPYSMEAVEDLFGPDQPLGGSGLGTSSGLSTSSGLWSPLKIASSAGSSFGGTAAPLKLSVLPRSVTVGSVQWPDSPSSAAGSPSGRSIWRGSSAALPDSPTAAAGSPKALKGPSGDGGTAVAFNPATDTSPLAQPEAALQQAMGALHAAALSQKKELDWQAQYEALRTVRRLALYHPAVLAPAPTLHALVGLAAPVIDALRSTMSRLAIAVFQGLVEALGPAMDAELDAFVPLLLKRAGQISISGRDNFLAVEADRALAAVVAHAGEARTVGALLNCLASKSPDVRAKAAMHLDACLQQHGARLMAGAGAGLLPRLLRAAVALLDEGGLEARTAGKRVLWELRRLLDAAAAGGGGADDFKRALARLDCKTDKVWDVLEAGRMPAAPARLPSAGISPPSGTSPASPTAASYSPAKPGIPAAGAAAGSTTAAAPRGSAMSSAAGSRAPSAGLGQGSNGAVTTAAAAATAGGSAIGTAFALPRQKQPATRPGSFSSGAGTQAGAKSITGGGGPSASGPAPVRRGSRPGSACLAGPAPTGSLAGLDGELQLRLEAAQAQMGSQEWKARLEGLEAVQAAVGAQAGALPAEAQLWLAGELTQRVVDANLKVQQKALAILNSVLEGTGAGLTPAAPALLPAICKCLDSGNPSVRQAADEAVDAVVRIWPVDSHLPLLMAALGSPTGGARGKEMLLHRLAGLAPPLWQSRPALIRQHVLPAVFSLLAAGRRPELRQMAQGALGWLAPVMGRELAEAAAASPLLGPAQQQLVTDTVAGASNPTR